MAMISTYRCMSVSLKGGMLARQRSKNKIGGWVDEIKTATEKKKRNEWKTAGLCC